MAKTSTQKKAKTSTNGARRTPRRSTRTPRLVAALPEALRTERVVSAAKNLEETRAGKEVERVLRGAGDALQALADRLTSFEERAEERFDALRLRVVDALPFEGTTFDDLSSDLSDRALKEIDDVLARLGLVRASVVDADRKALEQKLRALKRELKAAKSAALTQE